MEVPFNTPASMFMHMAYEGWISSRLAVAYMYRGAFQWVRMMLDCSQVGMRLHASYLDTWPRCLYKHYYIIHVQVFTADSHVCASLPHRVVSCESAS